MKYSNRLKETRVPIVDQNKCMKQYESSPITDNMFCAGTGETDACNGDSGGPATINEKLVGVVSSGIECASSEYPGVYMRIEHYTKWIHNITGVSQEVQEDFSLEL